jgi:uncharacterized protein (DUF427 family)
MKATWNNTVIAESDDTDPKPEADTARGRVAFGNAVKVD